MQGKDKCNFLRGLRKRIAEENNIEYFESECTFKGNCKGTCPKCDKELLDLTKKINKAGLGITAALGVSILSLSGCTDVDVKTAGDVIIDETETQNQGITSVELEGDVVIDETCVPDNETDEIDRLMGDIALDENYEVSLDEDLAITPDTEDSLSNE